MPPSNEPIKQKVAPHPVDALGRYPAEAYDFVQRGLGHTVQKVHGSAKNPKASRHVSGQQLCLGLRDYAIAQWGMLARTVLGRWNIHATIDFGRIVFHMIELGHMQKTDDDCLDDFRNVYDFRSAFEADYRVPVASL